MKLLVLSYIECAVGNLLYMFQYVTKYLYVTDEISCVILCGIEFIRGNLLLVLDSTEFLYSTDYVSALS